MIGRRDFIAGLSSAVALPLAARAQQPAVPVIGYLSTHTSVVDAATLVAFRQGLTETGYVEGRNVAIEYRFSSVEFDRLPFLFTELTRQQVAVIVFIGFGPMIDQMMRLVQTSKIPIILSTGLDPVQIGLVASFNRPGGNVTGIHVLTAGEMVGKHMSLLRELVPNATTIAMLESPAVSRAEVMEDEDAHRAAASLGLQLLVLNATAESEINAVFASLEQRRPDAVIVRPGSVGLVHAKLIAALAARLAVPVIYPRRENVEAGGLMSYGYDVADGYRRIGNYAGRILKGEKPADLPVFQPTRFQFIINLKTARTIGLTIPPTLLALADEVIE
jgi:putative ABC transport system substrate-binding protein